ncbi:hypothetical protein SBA3_2070020 [Candidatus Sulfopaludibacter sp. SbA3]|nr:hypothetical protein SBA3_2070020 [Candidatus Sulfopaludibacter sp. SbA3]
MEFQVTPAAKHGELRTRIQQDIAALREIQTDAPDGKLDAMRQGYTLANDADGRRQVATELMRVAPGSAAAADAGIEQWDEQNPYPDRSAPFAEFIAYHEKRWDAAKAWIDRWPNYGPAWTAALAALRAEGQDKNVVATLGRRIAAFLQQNPDSTLGFTDQPTLMVAERLAAAGVDLDLIPALLDRAATQSQARLDCDRKYAVRPMTEAEIARNFQSESWVTRKVQAILQARQGEAVASHATLQTLLKATDAASGDSLLAWRGITAACEAALLTESAGLARDAIARMSNTLATEPTATPVEIRTHGMHEADYWQSRARLSELEGRSADAVAFYMRATNATPRNFDPVGRGRFAALAEKAWSKLGGTADAWLAYNPDAAGSQPQAQWRDVHGPMPEFSLEDSAGRPVRAADFHGKTVFINVWATWCGPCQGELPWVQRLYDAVKDHRDVAILTFNVDENPGVIAQFMKEHGFTFPVVLAHDYIDNTMKVDAIPRNWIVDGEGTLRFERQAGFDETFLKDTMEAMARAK